jgi:hypothetical protein
MRYRPSCLYLLMPLKFDASESMECKGSSQERERKRSRERTVFLYEIHYKGSGVNGMR